MARDELFPNMKMPLIVSLPANDVVLARAAASAGADSLKVHLNVTHAASGTLFGDFAAERDKIEKIIASVPIPVGVMPGADAVATAAEMESLARMGVRFFDIYEYHMPEAFWSLEGMEAMPALGMESAPDAPERLNARGARYVEASVVPHAEYGAPLSVQDLQMYADLAARLDGAMIVPTQKRIQPDQARMLALAGVKGLMVGKIVTGDTALSIRDAVKKFRKAIDTL